MPHVQIPGVGVVEFPDSMSGDEIASAAKRLHDDANAPSVTDRAAAAGTTLGVPALLASAPGMVARGVEQVATSPLLSKVARFAEGKAGPAIGAIEGYQLATGKKNPVSAAADAAKEYAISRAPGLLQRLALKASPYVSSAAETVNGAMGSLAGAAEQGMSNLMPLVMSKEQANDLLRQMLRQELQRSMGRDQ